MRLTNEEAAKRRKAIAEYCRTHTRAQARAKFDVSDRLVRMACEEHGVDYDRSYGGNVPSILAIVSALKRARKGTTMVTIAERFNTSKQRVHQIYQEAVNEGLVPAGKFAKE
jgi:hypothetical protein